MCGIAGVLRLTPPGAGEPPPVSDAWLEALDQGIAHRGPDGHGRWSARLAKPAGTLDLAFVHRRLSIIDPACGQQPMVASDGSAAVVFNGCVYNHRDLRAELIGLGHQFTTDHSDTEVLLHGVKQWGADLPTHLDGMYAFAAWDAQRHTLVLARDPAGEKPLYLANAGPGLMAFASTVPSLLAWRRATGATHQVDAARVLLWLKHGYWYGPPLDVHELPPGAVWTTCRPDTLTPTTDVQHPARRLRPVRSVDERPSLDALLPQAVASRLDADVPLGCFLSGGVDSSVVAALARQHLRARGGRLRTFTVQMPDGAFDESPYAEAVAKHLGTDHATLPCRASAADDLVRLIARLGLPFGDSSLLPTYWVSAAARQHVKVALGGDGGDELFAGYRRYQANGLLCRYRDLGPSLRALPLPLFGGKPVRMAHALAYAGYNDLLSIFTTPQMDALTDGAFSRHVPPGSYPDVPPDARAYDFALYLPADLMRKVDTASMSVALEVRAPLLAREVVHAALSAPLSEIEAGEGRKGRLRQYARTLLPANLVDRPKMGFSLPLARWFRTDFGGLRTLLYEHLAGPDPFPNLALPISRRVITRLLDEHAASRHDHSQRLFSLLTLSIWAGSLRRSCGAGL